MPQCLLFVFFFFFPITMIHHLSPALFPLATSGHTLFLLARWLSSIHRFPPQFLHLRLRLPRMHWTCRPLGRKFIVVCPSRQPTVALLQTHRLVPDLVSTHCHRASARRTPSRDVERASARIIRIMRPADLRLGLPLPLLMATFIHPSSRRYGLEAHSLCKVPLEP